MVTQEQVLEAARLYYAKRWPGMYYQGVLASMQNAPDPREAEEEWYRRYRDLKDAHGAIVKHLRKLEESDGPHTRHSTVLRLFCPAMDAMMQSMEYRLRLAKTPRRDAWAPWLASIREFLEKEKPLSVKDVAVLRLLCMPGQLWNETLQQCKNPNDAIAFVARLARDALPPELLPRT